MREGTPFRPSFANDPWVRCQERGGTCASSFPQRAWEMHHCKATC